MYRFGFNGQEKDNEIAGVGNHLAFADYGYDPRIGRRWNVDPLASKMPSISPYAYCANNPVLLIDPDGRLPIIPWLLKAGAGAAADMLAQASMDYLFNSNTTSWSQAFDNVNYYQVARSGAEGLIPWRTPGGKIGRAALSASGDVVVNAMNNPNGYTAEQAGMDFTTGFIGDLAGGGFGQILNKYGSKSVINGLMDKMGYGAEQIRKMTGGFDGESVRKWYSDKVKGIDINIAPTEANARSVVGQRNALKQQGRDLMSDRKAAANLDITDPIRDFDYYNTKYSGDYQKIMQGGTKPNPAVNKKYSE
jgi:RHS repeat-associated protein